MEVHESAICQELALKNGHSIENNLFLFYNFSFNTFLSSLLCNYSKFIPPLPQISTPITHVVGLVCCEVD